MIFLGISYASINRPTCGYDFFFDISEKVNCFKTTIIFSAVLTILKVHFLANRSFVTLNLSIVK